MVRERVRLVSLSKRGGNGFDGAGEDAVVVGDGEGKALFSCAELG